MYVKRSVRKVIVGLYASSITFNSCFVHYVSYVVMTGFLFVLLVYLFAFLAGVYQCTIYGFACILLAPAIAFLCFGFGSPNGTRTRVSAVRGRCPRPLDDGTIGTCVILQWPLVQIWVLREHYWPCSLVLRLRNLTGFINLEDLNQVSNLFQPFSAYTSLCSHVRAYTFVMLDGDLSLILRLYRLLLQV